MKALKEKKTDKLIYFFPNPLAEFSAPDHELVTVEVKEIRSPLCAMCTSYDSCQSGLKGNDFDCSGYSTDSQSVEKEPITDITLESVKCTDGWYQVGSELGFSEKEISEIFEYGEYANFTLRIDKNLNIVGGKIHRHKPTN